ncbi:MAG: ActS/PrrB/RegB family redox-sensitive histidine kinase [Roseiarcus sp.]
MDAFDDEDFGQRARRLRVDTLIWLRWLAIFGQSAAVLVAHFALGLQFPIIACFLCIGASIVVNAALRMRFSVSHRLEDSWVSNVLGFDIAQLAALLWLTGGLANPFSILFLAPIMTSAVSLPRRRTLGLLGFTLVCATALEFCSLPLRWPGGAELQPPALYGAGMWTAIAVSATFVTMYANRIAEEARQLASALTATELSLARQQHLSQLDGLAAAAAHELGTPLATVALVVHELAAQPQIAAHCAEDLRLVEDQVARCRSILGKLSSPATIEASSLEETTLGDLIEEIVTPHRLLDVAIEVEREGSPPEPVCRRSAGMIYGLSNLVENAISFAESRVAIHASWTGSMVKIVITDDGPGFPPQVLARLGQPYLSTRGGARRREGEAAGGMGLGLFIANALLERSGASLAIANAPPSQRGAVATIAWPLDVFEHGRLSRRQALEGYGHGKSQ